MTILTDFLVDRIYPVSPGRDVETVATVKGRAVGTVRARNAGGTATFLGFRPRDDQSGSLGHDVRTWFAILKALGVYADPGDTEALSRTGEYLCCRFPNGAFALAPHFKDTEEDWDGGFGRDAERDGAYLQRVPAPSDAIDLVDFRIGPHTIAYSGRHALAFRANAVGTLLAFAGGGATQITIDGRTTIFADRAIDEVGWAPVEPECQGAGRALLRLRASDAVTLTLPAADLPAAVGVWAEGAAPGSRGARVAAHRDGDALVIAIEAAQAGRWLFVAPA